MIQTIGLSKKFKGHTVLREIDFELEKGSIYGIVGKNGSGKSVFLKLLAGLLYPTKGEIRIDGKKLERGKFPPNVGMVLDCTGFLPDLSGVDNLRLLASIRKKIGDERIREVLELVGLGEEGKKKAGKYSVGMKQKLAIAQAIMEYPDLLILDEALNGMDDSSTADMIRLLKKMRDDREVSILFVSHDQEDVKDLCDRVFRMKSGRLYG